MEYLHDLELSLGNSCNRLFPRIVFCNLKAHQERHECFVRWRTPTAVEQLTSLRCSWKGVCHG
jgi:hypothetical protein